MAEIVDGFPKEPGGREPKYPYDRWFDGRIWKLQKDQDFQVQTRTMMALIKRAASSREIELTITQRGDEIYLQASKEE